MKRCLYMCLLMFMLLPIVNIAQESNYLLLAKAYNYYKQPHQALNYINGITEESQNPELQLLKAKSSYYIGDYKEALNTLIKIHPKVDCSYELAQCYAQLEKATLATGYIEEHLKSKHKKFMFTIKSDAAFNSIENSTQWQNLWQKEWYTKAEMEFMDAAYEYKLGNIEQSNLLLEDFLAKRKSYHKAWHLLAKTELAMGNNKLALKHINEAIKLKKKEASYFHTKSLILINTQKPSKALQALNKALDLNPNFVEYNLLQIEFLTANEDYEKAVEKLEMFTKSINATALNILAINTYQQSGDYLSALTYANRSIANDRYNPNLYIKRAEIYSQTNTPNFAEKDYSMALDFTPFDAEIYYHRGKIRLDNNNIRGACSDFRKARQLGKQAAELYLQNHCNKH